MEHGSLQLQEVSTWGDDLEKKIVAAASKFQVFVELALKRDISIDVATKELSETCEKLKELLLKLGGRLKDPCITDTVVEYVEEDAESPHQLYIQPEPVASDPLAINDDEDLSSNHSPPKRVKRDQPTVRRGFIYPPNPRNTCLVCEKTFATMTARKRHELTHTKPFRCLSCVHRCAEKIKMKRHCLKHHKNENNFVNERDFEAKTNGRHPKVGGMKKNDSFLHNMEEDHDLLRHYPAAQVTFKTDPNEDSNSSDLVIQWERPGGIVGNESPMDSSDSGMLCTKSNEGSDCDF